MLAARSGAAGGPHRATAARPRPRLRGARAALTTHFKGNFPESAGLEGCDAPALGGVATPLDTADWRELLPRAKLRADTRHRFVLRRPTRVPVTHVRLNIFPDGGVARLRLWGRPVDPV